MLNVLGVEYLPLTTIYDDIYQFGLLVQCMLTREKPYFNLPYEEAVWAALLRDELSMCAATYENKAVLGMLDLVHKYAVGVWLCIIISCTHSPCVGAFAGHVFLT